MFVWLLWYNVGIRTPPPAGGRRALLTGLERSLSRHGHVGVLGTASSGLDESLSALLALTGGIPRPSFGPGPATPPRSSWSRRDDLCPWTGSARQQKIENRLASERLQDGSLVSLHDVTSAIPLVRGYSRDPEPAVSQGCPVAVEVFKATERTPPPWRRSRSRSGWNGGRWPIGECSPKPGFGRT